MSNFKRTAISLAALALTIQPALASAQEACLTESEVSDMVVYAAPHALRAVSTKCSAQLADDGFIALQSDELAGRYTLHADETWPGALSALALFASRDGGDPGAMAMMAQLPEDVVRPLVNELAAQKVSEKIKLDDCRSIERAIEALAPIEPMDAGRLLAVIASLVGPKNPPVCTAEN